MSRGKATARNIEWLHGELPRWVGEGLISPESADVLRARYVAVERRSAATVAVIGLGALGASFIIGGVILLLAANWENIGRGMRAAIAFAPLLAGQAAVGYTLLRKRESAAWREGSALFLTGAVAASIALIGQTYHLPGDMASFLWIWLLLAWPLIYLLNASLLAGAAMYGALWWAGESSSEWKPLLAGVFIAAILPHLAWACRRNPHGLRFQFLLWCAVPWVYALMPAFDLWEWNMWALSTYALLGSALLLFGVSGWAGPVWNPALLAGGGSTASLAITLTMAVVWDEQGWGDAAQPWEVGDYASWAFRLLLAALCAAMLLPQLARRNAPMVLWGALGIVVLAVQLLIELGAEPVVFTLLFHAYVLALAAVSLRDGVRSGGLVLTNVGMGLIAAYAVLRFIDLDVPFLLRGVLFIFIGAGFLAGNIFLARKARKTQEKIS